MTAAQIAPLVVGEVRAAQSSKEDSGHALHPLCRAATLREACVSVVSILPCRFRDELSRSCAFGQSGSEVILTFNRSGQCLGVKLVRNWGKSTAGAANVARPNFSGSM